MKRDRGLPGPQGFTLIEILTIVLILGIVATFALPSLQSGIGKSRLSGAVSEIVSALEYARLAAMSSGEKTRVTIDPDSDRLLVESFKINGDPLSGATRIPETDIDGGTFVTMPDPVKVGEDYVIGFGGEGRFHNVRVASSVFGDGFYVIFDQEGTPSSGGTVLLTYGDEQRTITVDALTGDVSSSP